MPVKLPVNPTDPLASEAELAAQTARIDQLWAKVFGAGPTPSPTNTFITLASQPPIVDDALNQWSLVASAGHGLQIAVQKTGAAPPPVLDGITQMVTTLGIQLVGGKRTIVQKNSAGNCYETVGPGSPWVQFSGPVPP